MQGKIESCGMYQAGGGGVLKEFLGEDVPLGPWNPSPIPELVQLNFATLYTRVNIQHI